MNIVDVNDEVWVFLSHSHNDYEKVIQVRNLLENRGFRPLMFFLKCLEEDREIDNLIKREIDSRYRFILCDSKNAQSSEWVRKEVEYIKTDKKRYFETIDIETMTMEEIDSVLEKFEKRTCVTICYTSDRNYYCSKVIDDLKKYGFRIKKAEVRDIEGETFVKEIESMLSTGFVVLMLNNDTINEVAEHASSIEGDTKNLIFLKPNDTNALDKILKVLRPDQIMDLSTYSTGDMRAELIEYAADNGGAPTLQLLLGYIYEEGRYGVKPDLKRALQFFEDAHDYDGIATYQHIERVKKKMETK